MSKEPIRLRQKALSNGNISLYLDIYTDGKRRYEFLKLYLVPERTKQDKLQNKQTLTLAQSIKSQRILELQTTTHGFDKGYAPDTLFFAYYEALCEQKIKNGESKNNWGVWYSNLVHLRKYEPNNNITFAQITKDWITGYQKYLDTALSRDNKPLSKNSRCAYYNKVKACIKHAFNNRIIPYNPLVGLESIKGEEGTRMYLTIDEVKILAQTECPNEIVKRAFLFSCLTGLRRSDIQKLQWSDIHEQDGFTRIIFRQKKTKQQEYLDITEQASRLLGEPTNENDKPFGGLPVPTNTNTALKVWCARAGIKKDITFHCGRHTFATMMLDLGTDIFTVSKLLGHAQVNTTMIYAKVLDKNKQKAVANIPNIL